MAENSSHSGIGFFGLLALLFITLKLTKIITWSWFLVLSPILFPLIFILAIVFIACIIILVKGKNGKN